MSHEQPETDEEESGEKDENIAVQLGSASRATRRKFMATGAAAWATASVAGCISATGSTETGSQADMSAAQGGQSFVVADDIGAGSQGVPDTSFVSACSPTRKFVPGMQAVWWIDVYDPQSGEPVSNDTIDAMEVEFVNRDWDPVELTWAGDDEEHPADEWNGSTVLPQDASPGTVQYKINISNGGGDYKMVGIAASEFDVIQVDDPVTFVVSNYTYAISSPPESSGFVSACGPEWQFKPGMDVVFAANIFDAETGAEPGPDRIDRVRVQWPNGNRPGASGFDGYEPVELEWQGDAGEHAERVWEGGFTIPEDARTGTYEYRVAITSEADNVYDVGIATDTFTVINPSRGQ